MDKIYKMITSGDMEMRELGVRLIARNGKDYIVNFLDKYGIVFTLKDSVDDYFIKKEIRFKIQENNVRFYIRMNDYILYCGHCLTIFSTENYQNSMPNSTIRVIYEEDL